MHSRLLAGSLEGGPVGGEEGEVGLDGNAGQDDAAEHVALGQHLGHQHHHIFGHPRPLRHLTYS